MAVVDARLASGDERLCRERIRARRVEAIVTGWDQAEGGNSDE
jgi:hypothetical protein